MNKIIVSGYLGRDPEVKYLPKWRWHTIEELDKMPLESWSRYILDTMLGRV